MDTNELNNIGIIRSNISAHVKRYMQINNIPFSEVALKLDMGKSTAWRLCFDKVTNPQLKSLLKIADTLEITLNELLTINPKEADI